MATIAAGVKNTSRTGIYLVGNGAARFLKDRNSEVATNTKNQASRALRHVVFVGSLSVASSTSRASNRPPENTKP